MKKLAFLVVVMLLAPALAPAAETAWTGAGDGWRYADPLNWDNGLPGTIGVEASIMYGYTATVDVPGMFAGDGDQKYLYLGYIGNGYVNLVPGGEITGSCFLGLNGTIGAVNQTGGKWIGGNREFRIGSSATGYGEYNLQAGSFGADFGDPSTKGLATLFIGVSGPGQLIQAAGTHVQVRADNRLVISYNSSNPYECAGVYTMNGGSLRTDSFHMGLYGAIPLSATWNINSKDVDILIGYSRKVNPTIPVELKLGYRIDDGEASMRVYISAVEGLPGQTVPIEIVGGRFRNLYYGAGGRDADCAGLNNITMEFTSQPTDSLNPDSRFEVGGTNMGAVVAGLTNNFALEGLVVGGAAGGDDANYLTMVDNIDNMADGAGNEVLYTQNLTVNADSILFLGGRTVYYYKNTGPALEEGTNYILDGGALVQLPGVDGDADRDLTVGVADFYTLGSNWGDGGRTWEQGDFNGDSNVDETDFYALGANWTTGGGAAVPEPVTLTLLGIGGLALLRRCRK